MTRTLPPLVIVSQRISMQICKNTFKYAFDCGNEKHQNLTKIYNAELLSSQLKPSGRGTWLVARCPPAEFALLSGRRRSPSWCGRPCARSPRAPPRSLLPHLAARPSASASPPPPTTVVLPTPLLPLLLLLLLLLLSFLFVVFPPPFYT